MANGSLMKVEKRREDKSLDTEEDCRILSILSRIKAFRISPELSLSLLAATCHLGDNCIQIFHLGRCIVEYMVGNLVLKRCASGAVKCDFRSYIQ